MITDVDGGVVFYGIDDRTFWVAEYKDDILNVRFKCEAYDDQYTYSDGVKIALFLFTGNSNNTDNIFIGTPDEALIKYQTNQ